MNDASSETDQRPPVGQPLGGLDRLAVDTGGTFTDVVTETDSGVEVHKLLSTPDDPSRAVVRGSQILAAGRGVRLLVHGTTVATNALLERKGARCALITNRGFEDLLALGRQARHHLYSFELNKPEPLISPERIFGVSGRLSADGAELEAIDLAEIDSLARRLRAEGVDSVAVSLLHGYANPAPEEAIRARLFAAWSDAETPVNVTLSTEVNNEFREFERTSTAAVNAFVAPTMGQYLRRTASAIAPTELRVVLSNGALSTPEYAAQRAADTVLSGPAGGVVGALRAAKRVGIDSIITFDMGGTSTDVALCAGEPPMAYQLDLGGWPIRVPSLDIHTVGAGGGSLAWLDAAGVLRVGPKSAGAQPGPACYGRGGTGATVTDANLVRGHLLADAFLGGEMRLDVSAATAAVDTIATRLGRTRQETALGICRIANATMERALKVISVAKGNDPREYTLVAFGGAGGMHACELARGLRIPRVLLPPHPGLLSAMGMLGAESRVDASRTLLLPLPPEPTPADLAPANQAMEALRADVRTRAAADGIETSRLRTSLRADLRYRGQSFELTVAWNEGALQAFHQLHESRYGYAMRDSAVELVTARAAAFEPSSPPPNEGIPDERTAARSTGQSVPGWPGAAVYRRDDLSAGDTFDGPALLVEYSSTTAIQSHWHAVVTTSGSILLHDRRAP